MLLEICVTYLLFQKFQEYHIPTNIDKLYFIGGLLAIYAYIKKYAFLDYLAKY